MGLRIATNLPAQRGIRALEESQDKQGKVLARLSSGNRIARAGDDAAGLAVSEKLRAGIRSMNQARRNAQDGMSMVQTAEGGMMEITNILVRMRELSIQAASDTIGDAERAITTMEYEQLVREVDRIAEVTQFNKTDLLNGKGGDLDFQVGIYAEPDANRIHYSAEKSDVKSDRLGIDGTNVQTRDGAADNLDKIDRAMGIVNQRRAELGAIQNRLESTVNNLGINIENHSMARSRIRDADFAVEASELVKYNILNSAGTAVLAQANQTPKAALNLL